MEKNSKPNLFKAATELAEVIKTIINDEIGFKRERKRKIVKKRKRRKSN